MLMPYHSNQWCWVLLLVCIAFTIELFSKANNDRQTLEAGKLISFEPCTSFRIEKEECWIHSCISRGKTSSGTRLHCDTNYCNSGDYKQISALNANIAAFTLKAHQLQNKTHQFNVLCFFSKRFLCSFARVFICYVHSYRDYAEQANTNVEWTKLCSFILFQRKAHSMITKTQAYIFTSELLSVHNGKRKMNTHTEKNGEREREKETW